MKGGVLRKALLSRGTPQARDADRVLGAGCWVTERRFTCLFFLLSLLCPSLWKSSTPASSTCKAQGPSKHPRNACWPPAMPAVAINFVPTFPGRRPLERGMLGQFTGWLVVAEGSWGSVSSWTHTQHWLDIDTSSLPPTSPKDENLHKSQYLQMVSKHTSLLPSHLSGVCVSAHRSFRIISLYLRSPLGGGERAAAVVFLWGKTACALGGGSLQPCRQ